MPYLTQARLRALLALELARFEGGDRFEGGRNYLFISSWAPPHGRARRYRGREADCEFCSQPGTQAALAAVWPELGLPEIPPVG